MTEPYTPYESSEESYEWDYDDRPRAGGKVLWGRILALAVALFLAFLLGRSTAPAGPDPDRVRSLEREVEELEQTNADLEALLTAEPTPTPTDTATETDTTEETTEEEPAGQTYVVKRGDTLRGIAQTFCGDPSFDDAIADYNDIADPTNLPIGAEITIPPDCGE